MACTRTEGSPLPKQCNADRVTRFVKRSNVAMKGVTVFSCLMTIAVISGSVRFPSKCSVLPMYDLAKG